MCTLHIIVKMNRHAKQMCQPIQNHKTFVYSEVIFVRIWHHHIYLWNYARYLLVHQQAAFSDDPDPFSGPNLKAPMSITFPTYRPVSHWRTRRWWQRSSRIPGEPLWNAIIGGPIRELHIRRRTESGQHQPSLHRASSVGWYRESCPNNARRTKHPYRHSFPTSFRERLRTSPRRNESYRFSGIDRTSCSARPACISGRWSAWRKLQTTFQEKLQGRRSLLRTSVHNGQYSTIWNNATKMSKRIWCVRVVWMAPKFWMKKKHGVRSFLLWKGYKTLHHQHGWDTPLFLRITGNRGGSSVSAYFILAILALQSRGSMGEELNTSKWSSFHCTPTCTRMQFLRPTLGSWTKFLLFKSWVRALEELCHQRRCQQREKPYSKGAWSLSWAYLLPPVRSRKWMLCTAHLSLPPMLAVRRWCNRR